MIIFLAGIGVLTLGFCIFMLLRWAWEETVLHAYRGLKVQIKELGDDLTAVLESENAASSETEWVIREMVKAAQTREWTPRDRLRNNFHDMREPENE